MSAFDNKLWHVYSVEIFQPFSKQWIVENRYYMKEVELKENKYLKNIQYLGLIEKEIQFSTERDFSED
jgi:hypothetical protein